MESSSRASSSTERTPHKFANFLGTLIGLLTLTVPLVTIAYFSSANQPSWQSPQFIPQVRR